MKKMILESEDTIDEKDKNEINILKSLYHPNLIFYKEDFIEHNALHIIMEYAEGGDLAKIVSDAKKGKKTISEEMIWKWFLQLAQAIRYMHSKHVIHRDIKCQNIFLTKNLDAKLGDFGISKMLFSTGDKAVTFLGTPYFLSPEMVQHDQYNYKVDVWMLGCVMYELTCLEKPFLSNGMMGLFKKILNEDIKPINQFYSNDLRELIAKLLLKDPNQRPSIKDVLNFPVVINKMKEFGYDKKYDDWNKCPNHVNNLLENDFFSTGMNLSSIYSHLINDDKNETQNNTNTNNNTNNNENESNNEGTDNNASNINVNLSTTLSNTIYDSTSTEGKIQQYINKKGGNEQKHKTPFSKKNVQKEVHIEIVEESSERINDNNNDLTRQFSKTTDNNLLRSHTSFNIRDVISGSNYKTKFKYDEGKFGKDNTTLLISIMEDQKYIWNDIKTVIKDKFKDESKQKLALEITKKILKLLIEKKLIDNSGNASNK